MPQILLVRPDSSVMAEPSTTILARYPDGRMLVRTDAVIEEAARDGDTVIEGGLRLAGKKTEDVQRGREAFKAASEAGDDRPIFAYIELAGPPLPEMLEQIKGLGIMLLTYQPENAYLARGKPAALKEAQGLLFVTRVTMLIADLKQQAPPPNEAGTTRVWVVVAGRMEDAPAIIRDLRTLPGVTIEQGVKVDQVNFYLRIPAEVDVEGHDALIHQSRVIATEPFAEPQLEDELAGLILAGQTANPRVAPSGSYLRWLEDNGINGKGVTIGIVDGGVDVSHPAFKGRIRDLAHGARSWHGTFVAGHAAGAFLDEKDHSGLIYGLGMAPAAELLAQDKTNVATAPGTVCRETVTQAGPSGIVGSVQNNSWGTSTQTPMDYGSLEASYDALVRNADGGSGGEKPLTICFSSGNSGPSGLTRPKGSKNAIVTGNSESCRPDVGGTDSDNIDESYTGTHPSSYGNCGDLRIRPDVMAPGEWTSSASYDCQRGEREYVSDRVTWGGGSSGASPKTAGACALLIDWWHQHDNGKNPSPAMLRALIVNGAVPMNAGGPIPNMRQGWGRLNLANILAQDVGHVYLDQAILLKQFGETKEWHIQATDPTQPVKITLAYTDPPANIGTGGSPDNPAIVNRLALRVDMNGTLYPANNFSQGWSVPNSRPQREGVDNLQNIFLQAGTFSGKITVSVTALQLAANCLSGMPDQPQQDFALVISNGRLDAAEAPADVFVVLDRAAGGQPKADRPGDFHAPGSDDSQNTSGSFWNNVDAQAGAGQGPQGPQSTPGAGSSTSADDWWKSPDLWARTETQKAGDETERAGAAAAGLAPATDVLLASGHSLFLPGGGANTESGEDHESLGQISPETEREEAYRQATEGSLQDLSVALARLMRNWQAFGGPRDGNVARRRVGVIVVGAGTRVTQQDLAALRRLSFLGELYLVSDHAPVLAWLAQRIHRLQGIAFRLADGADDLENVLRKTLAEASGAQQAPVKSETETGPNARLSNHSFQVSSLDRQLIVRIAGLTGDPNAQLRVKRPGADAVTLTELARQSGVRVQPAPNGIEIVVDAAPQAPNWAGTWSIVVRQKVDAAPAAVDAWARGGLNLALHSLGSIQSESGRGDEEHMLSLRSPGDARLSSVRLEPRTIAADASAEAESVEPVTTAAEASRLDREAGAAAGETGRTPTAATLAARVRMPGGRQAAILDLSAEVNWVDDAGRALQRYARLNLLRLEPRSDWRRRMNQEEQPVVVQAEITEVVLGSDNLPIALRLRRDDRQKYVQVNLPGLRQHLAYLKPLGKRFSFGISGQELVTLVQMIDEHQLYAEVHS